MKRTITIKTEIPTSPAAQIFPCRLELYQTSTQETRTRLCIEAIVKLEVAAIFLSVVVSWLGGTYSRHVLVHFWLILAGS